MTHKFFILVMLLVSVTFLNCSNNKTQDSTQPPNIIVIFADDLGYGDLGCYGHPTIKTPHLDRLAEEGMRFTQFYVGAAVCTPSRAALLTGRLPVRSGLDSDNVGVFFPFSTSGISAEELTMAEGLKNEGYATAMFGKWHLGHHEEFLPTNHGFDEYFGIPYSNDMSAGTNNWAVAQKFPKLPLMEGTEIIETETDQTQLTKRYTQRAIDFIEKNKSNPFFLYLPHTFPHIPLFASDEFKGKSSRGLYGDVVEELDWSVGQILKTLKEQGLDKNTFVFFTSDNGPWLTVGDAGGSQGLLKQGKNSCWEGGMRVPAIAWWPGQIKASQTTQALGTTMDLFATVMKLGGATVPGDRVMDGYDLMPLLTGSTESIRNEIFYYHGNQLFAVRKGSWKIHFKTINPYVGEQAESFDPPLLFNVDTDPSEKYNVNEKHPEIVEELKLAGAAHLQTVERIPSRLEIVDSTMVTPWW